MTIDELAAFLRVAKSMLYELAHEGKVPGQKVGKPWRFSGEAVDRWLESRDRSTGREQSSEEGARE